HREDAWDAAAGRSGRDADGARGVDCVVVGHVTVAAAEREPSAVGEVNRGNTERIGLTILADRAERSAIDVEDRTGARTGEVRGFNGGRAAAGLVDGAAASDGTKVDV